jgi:predicted ATPase/DNA-binding SARP family transcriptional activator
MGKPMDAPCRIELLGGLRVHQGQRVITRFQTHKTGALLAYLAYFRHQSHAREELIEILWPEDGERQARHKLSMVLTALRRQLEPPGVPAGSVIIANQASVQLNPAACTTDVAEFEAALEAASGATSTLLRVQLLAPAVAWYRGPLLPRYQEEWIPPEQQRLAEAHRDALNQLVYLAERAGDRQQALQWARRGSAIDPLWEEGGRHLARLAAADECVPPGPPLEQGEFPSPRAWPAPGTHVPLHHTGFFGRERETARLRELLLEEQTRLVTLTGPGGVGKTRLAVETARAHRDHVRDVVAFVPLADLTDPRLIADRLLDALQIGRSPQEEPTEQLADVLSHQPALLVLDNFEHLAPAGAPLVQSPLQQTPGLVALVTSRQRLGVAGEREFPVLPLETPPPTLASLRSCPLRGEGSRTPPSAPPLRGEGGLTPDALIQCASVQLFVDRAQAVVPDFQLTGGNAAAVALLCQRLEGLPLAIELAAARVKVLTPAQMLARLEQPFELLVAPRRPVEHRHRSLRVAIEWSYQLLSPDLQRFFAHLSVFRGGWTLEAAEVVGDHREPLHALEQLLQCSLVMAEEADAEMRYRMLETVREYAGEQLESLQEGEPARRRHAQHFLTLAEQARPHLSGAEQVTWSERLEGDHDNLRAAMVWALAHEPETASRLACALGPFWSMRCYWTEGLDWFEQCLALGDRVTTERRAQALVLAGSFRLGAGDQERARELFEASLNLNRQIANQLGIAEALHHLGKVALAGGDYARARVLLEDSLTIREELGDREGTAALLHSLGFAVFHQGDYPGARRLFEECLAIRRELGDRRAVAYELLFLGLTSLEQGDPARAQDGLEESREIFRASGDRLGVAWWQSNMGGIALAAGDTERARELFEEGLATRTEHQDQRGISYSLAYLGDVAAAEGDYPKARSFYERSLELRRRLGLTWEVADSLCALGRLAQAEGDVLRARACYRESLEIQGELGTSSRVPPILEGLAQIASRQGQPERAARLLGAAAALREAASTPVPPADRADVDSTAEAASAALGASAFAAAWDEGRVMSLHRAIAEASEVAGP